MDTPKSKSTEDGQEVLKTEDLNLEKGIVTPPSETLGCVLGEEDPRIKKIKRKVDLRLSLILAVMYVVNQIDRTNLPNAAIAGMKEDLNMTGNRYTIVVLIMFPFYTLVNPIATVLARKFGPRQFLSFVTAAFGVVVVGFGLAKDWTDQLGLRIALGTLEGCFFPCALFLVSTWYVRAEVAKRNAFFYLLGNSLGGFGGVLAYGLQQMDGVGGLEGWRWMFIWEGILTVLIAAIGFFTLVDFPDVAHKSYKFLTDEELKLMVDRVERDRGDAHITEFNIWSYLAEGKDWKIWCFALNFGMAATVSYSVAYFLPIIFRNDLGFSVIMSQCLTAPCYVFSFILGLSEAWLSDKYQYRGLFIFINSVLEIVGIAILGYAQQPYVRYFGAFLVTAGCNANVCASMTYQANNVVGQWKRAFTSATMVASGGIGGILGTVVFRAQDAPGYRPGLYTCFAAASITIVSATATQIYMWRMNKKQAAGLAVIEGVPGFRYTL